jgi:hypothetical protein
MVTLKPPALDFGPIIGPISRPADFLVLQTTQVHPYGRRYLTWNGKVFKYCRALGTLNAGYGAMNIANATVARLINSVTPAALAVGQQQIPVTIAATEAYAGDGVVAENELVGADITLGHGAAATTETRTIMGNSAGASGGSTIQVLLDEPLAVAHDAGVACECPLNPYRYLGVGSLDYNAVMCVPNQLVTTGVNFWGQTWGPCWCVPGGNDSVPGNSANDRLVCFVGDGSVNGATALTMETGYQIAGFIIDTTASGTGAMPLVMLQISS